MKINKDMSWFTDTYLGTFLIQVIISVAMFIIIKYTIHFMTSFVATIGVSIAFGRSIYGLLYLKYNFLGEGGNASSSIKGKIQPIATSAILMIAGFIILNIESTRQQTIQTQIKNIKTNELKLNISKSFVEDREEDRWLRKWQIVIKNKMEVKNIETKETRTSTLTNREKESFLKTLKEIKAIDSTWDKNYHGKNTWLIEIATDANYLAFTKSMMNIEIKNEKKQKAVLKLLRYIDSKLEPLTGTTALNTNYSRRNQ